MKRGDIITIAVSGDYGKPRPALVVQADEFAAIPSVTVLRLTSDIYDEDLLRITVMPHKQNGLRIPSQICIDKAVTIPKDKIGKRIGTLDAAILKLVNRALGIFLGLGGKV
ncbi:MAG: type II toxin-antitoxin system PemK/MazF family toxin [Gammaproteobacteria bacterium]|nr:type II toxin-antitoxin system PemK/MazF family toxin [Gammaproteobacteria bacterium]